MTIIFLKISYIKTPPQYTFFIYNKYFPNYSTHQPYSKYFITHFFHIFSYLFIKKIYIKKYIYIYIIIYFTLMVVIQSFIIFFFIIITYSDPNIIIRQFIMVRGVKFVFNLKRKLIFFQRSFNISSININSSHIKQYISLLDTIFPI